MQASKTLTDSMAMMFTNPLLAIVMAMWPWHPRARAFKQAKACVQQASFALSQLCVDFCGGTSAACRLSAAGLS